MNPRPMACRHCAMGSSGDSGGTIGPSVGLPLLDHLRAWLVSDHQDLSHPLRPRQRTTLMAQLERAKVEVEYEEPRHCRQHTVVGVSRMGADRQAVLFPGEEAGRRGLLTIAEYFHRVYGLHLLHPGLNCVELLDSVFVPIELVRIISLPNMRGANLYQNSPSPKSSPALSISPTTTEEATASPTVAGATISPTVIAVAPAVTAPPTATTATFPHSTNGTCIGVSLTGTNDTTASTTNTTVTTTSSININTTSTTSSSTSISTTTNTTTTPSISPATSQTTEDPQSISCLESRFLLDLRMLPRSVSGSAKAKVGLEAEAPQAMVSCCQVKERQRMHSPAALHTWALYSYDRTTTSRDLSTFLIHLKQAGQCRGVEVSGPVQLRFPTAHHPHHNLLIELQDLTATYPGLQLVMAVLDDYRLYGQLKVVGDLCLGVVTQCVLPATVRQLCPVALRNLVRQINTKLGGSELRIPRITPPPHLAPSLMVMALHHNTAPNRTGMAVAAVIASVSLSAGRYLTEVQTQTPRDSAIVDLTNMTCRLLASLTGQHGRPVPEQILVYSDGLEDWQALRVMHTREWGALTAACRRFMTNYRPHITYVAIHGSPLGWVALDKMGHSPASSRTLDLRSHRFGNNEFTIYASSDSKSCQSAHYSILRDSSGIPLEEVERFTRVLCHLPGTHHCSPQPIPCPVIYARRAAHRCHQHMKTLLENWTQRDYKELRRDISRMVRVDTTYPIAHQVYYI